LKGVSLPYPPERNSEIDDEAAFPAATYSADNVRRRPPPRRRLQIFAVDPGASNRLTTAFINKTVIDIPWEGEAIDATRSAGSVREEGEATPGKVLGPGPVGEYIEVVDVDPASGMAYPPIDLNDPYLLAENGLSPSEGNPQFHQQMVYAVTMRTIEAFESALGRRALWATKRPEREEKNPSIGKLRKKYKEEYVQRLRIYPHALRQANAYYSPDKIALLFGYFPEMRSDVDDEALGGMVFTCLSHDIVAHETTHALLDGLHRRYQEASNVDVLAFHEAFADIVAMFQHFTFPELLKFEIARTRGDLRTGNFMADLAQQFGMALNRSRALRSAIGVDPEDINYASATEPHQRGSILVAAVFSAFLMIYQRRIDDLLRIATGGSGVLHPGAIHPDLVGRLAHEASKSASHVLEICIRALDYPVDITFSDYLRALITADADLVGVDKFGYRVAFLEAFRDRGIYPDEVRTLSVESLRWSSPQKQPRGLAEFLRDPQTFLNPKKFRRQHPNFDWTRNEDRRGAFDAGKLNAGMLHEWLSDPKNLTPQMAESFGLNRNANPSTADFRLDRTGRPTFEVHSVRPAYRVAPDADIKTDVIAVITQRRRVAIDPNDPPDRKKPEDPEKTFWFRGGCTLIIDPANDEEPIRYAIRKDVMNESRLARQRMFVNESQGMSLRGLYFGGDSGTEKEPFALLHIGY
jgi:hypothetical protein